MIPPRGCEIGRAGQVRQLYLELQSGSATPTPRQRNKDTGVEPALFCRLQLTANELQRLLPVDWQHVIGKPRYIHDQAFLGIVSCERRAGQLRSISSAGIPAIRDPVVGRRLGRAVTRIGPMFPDNIAPEPSSTRQGACVFDAGWPRVSGRVGRHDRVLSPLLPFAHHRLNKAVAF
jgi:hypothetical protein